MIAVLWLVLASGGATEALAQASAVASSTKTVESVSSLYRADRLRDPFAPATGGGRGRAPSGDGSEPAPFDIHDLILKGIMQDVSGDFAVLTSNSGATYVLRGGKIYDYKDKMVPNVSGSVKAKQKTVHVMMTDSKDVQTLVLGEEEGL